MNVSHSAWGKTGAEWRSILGLIEGPVQMFKESLQAKYLPTQFLRERGDAPMLEVQWWEPDKISRSLQVIVTGDKHSGYKLQIQGIAWRDFDQPKRQRKWIMHEIDTISLPDDLRKFDTDDLRYALDTAKKKVCSWDETDLTRTADLPEKRPANIDSSKIRGFVS